MKTFLLFLFMFNPPQGDSVKYEIRYNLQYQPGTLTPDYKPNAKMILQVGENYSCFQSLIMVKKDSIDLVRKQMFESGTIDTRKLASLKTNFNYRVFYENKSERIRVENSIITHKMYYNSSAENLHWELHNEHQNLYGFNCQKATISYAGRDYTAWFSPDIPINDGPYIFKGLPGLILKIYDEEEHYVFTLEGISNAKGLMSKPGKEFIESDYDKVSEMKRLYRLDPALVSENIAAYTSGMPNYERTKKIRAETKNNPMEKNQ